MIIAEALRYSLRGWATFPLKPRSKLPAIARGFYSATTNPATLRRWFGSTAGYNIGIRTGVASCLLVLDTDIRHGGPDTLQALEDEHGTLPATLTVITPGGDHRYFRADGQIPSSAGRLGPGIDIKADGGYVVAPSSVHPDGPTYRWVDPDAPLAGAPAWLVDRARRRSVKGGTVVEPPLSGPSKLPPSVAISQRAISSTRIDPGAYGAAALENEIAELASTPHGGRNNALNRASFSLHQLVASGELDGGEVERRLIAATAQNGLLADDGLRQVLATIRSGARAGSQHPRSRP
jgi:hypothetical protein